MSFLFLSGVSASAQETACARVTIQISQDAVITRTVFRATLTITNDSPELLQQVLVDLDLRDSANQPANSRFGGLYAPEVNPNIGDVYGTGVIPPGVTATAVWTIFPTDQAAPSSSAESYTVGGHFSYLQGGNLVNVPLYPAPIQVLPDAKLFLKYFLQSPVYSDNPFQLLDGTNPIEPAEPFSLGLLVTNAGHGAARGMRITSSQPRITRNDNGLVVNFNILGAQVGTQSISPTLAVTFGDIPPNGSAVARWLMSSTLQGEFIAYNATFEHVNALNNPALSLIERVDIYELNHVVLLPGEDALPDFLVNNRGVEGGCPSADPGADDIPDCVHSSDGTVLPVHAVLDGTIDSPPTNQNLIVHLMATASQGDLNFIRVMDPGAGSYSLARAVRLAGAGGAGVELSTGGPGDIVNAWTTHRWLPIDGPPMVEEHRLYILDDLPAGGGYTYELTYMPALQVDSVLVNAGLTQRSNVTEVAVDFTASNNMAALIGSGSVTNAVTLWQRPVGGGSLMAVPLSADRYTYDSSLMRLRVDLTTDSQGPGKTTMLGDGNYELQLLANSIRATFGGGPLALTDGSQDGIFRFGVEPGQNLFRLRGDGTGDRLVDDMDEQGIRNSWLQMVGQSGYNANADLNSSGIVNFQDIQLVRNSWLNMLEF
ncbi:MAG: hypothetical protein IPK83_17050 [Planctomycetes bacterium]|nr:hypothetical protein [Planctomycetota bacterium]